MVGARSRSRRIIPALLFLRAGILLGALGLTPAACYTGSARDISPRAIAADPGWILVSNVPAIRQQAEMDCGAAALAMVLGHWSLPIGAAEISAAYPDGHKQGIKAGQLRDFARAQGLQAFIISGQVGDLLTELSRGHPVVVGLVKPYGKNRSLAHYEVVIGIHRARRLILTLDPAGGWRENGFDGFAREWLSARQVTLVVFPTDSPLDSPAGPPAEAHAEAGAADQRSPGASWPLRSTYSR